VKHFYHNHHLFSQYHFHRDLTFLDNHLLKEPKGEIKSGKPVEKSQGHLAEIFALALTKLEISQVETNLFALSKQPLLLLQHLGYQVKPNPNQNLKLHSLFDEKKGRAVALVMEVERQANPKKLQRSILNLLGQGRKKEITWVILVHGPRWRLYNCQCHRFEERFFECNLRRPRRLKTNNKLFASIFYAFFSAPSLSFQPQKNYSTLLDKYFSQSENIRRNLADHLACFFSVQILNSTVRQIEDITCRNHPCKNQLARLLLMRLLGLFGAFSRGYIYNSQTLMFKNWLKLAIDTFAGEQRPVEFRLSRNFFILCSKMVQISGPGLFSSDYCYLNYLADQKLVKIPNRFWARLIHQFVTAIINVNSIESPNSEPINVNKLIPFIKAFFYDLPNYLFCKYDNLIKELLANPADNFRLTSEEKLSQPSQTMEIIERGSLPPEIDRLIQKIVAQIKESINNIWLKNKNKPAHNKKDLYLTNQLENAIFKRVLTHCFFEPDLNSALRSFWVVDKLLDTIFKQIIRHQNIPISGSISSWRRKLIRCCLYGKGNDFISLQSSILAWQYDTVSKAGQPMLILLHQFRRGNSLVNKPIDTGKLNRPYASLARIAGKISRVQDSSGKYLKQCLGYLKRINEIKAGRQLIFDMNSQPLLQKLVEDETKGLNEQKSLSLLSASLPEYPIHLWEAERVAILPSLGWVELEATLYQQLDFPEVNGVFIELT